MNIMTWPRKIGANDMESNQNANFYRAPMDIKRTESNINFGKLKRDLQYRFSEELNQRDPSLAKIHA